ncbi:hypothetical protein EJ05DRAFT_503210 [Pseudovirgaria hyperparasitica]|uniref:Uncharacterized protein n=1 Tax=Pseudovirgaria hyperparasitica TaxID=470096 RepID=A0A6A6W2D7_9PEZI|nr:uncharacterized protein EJ05DRAFT_503210 [Pseudovirgaria hyperparasitica]KAF2755757.1 hypothetical protein EJ05DRAFT_503210 [Pseudovirgaria hyperparasitica]
MVSHQSTNIRQGLRRLRSRFFSKGYHLDEPTIPSRAASSDPPPPMPERLIWRTKCTDLVARMNAFATEVDIEQRDHNGYLADEVDQRRSDNADIVDLRQRMAREYTLTCQWRDTANRSANLSEEAGQGIDEMRSAIRFLDMAEQAMKRAEDALTELRKRA